MVSIRAPRAGRDAKRFFGTALEFKFLSARPGRGATALGGDQQAVRIVSIRAPRAGRDVFYNLAMMPGWQFLSARPGRGATIKKMST